MTRPTWENFGTHDESAYPELWDGVIGAWAPCLGPTGSRLHDMSRRANWGALTNMDNATDWVVDSGQYALDFDGSNDHVAIGTGLNALAGGQLSISAWVSFRAYSGTQAIISNVDVSGSNLSFVLEFGRQANKTSFLTGNAVDLYSTATVNDAAYKHVIAIRAGQSSAWSITLGINGVFNSANTSTNPSPPPGGLSIGRAGDFNGQYLNGVISDVTIWNRALTINEALQLYQLGRGGMYQRRRRRAIYLPQDGGAIVITPPAAGWTATTQQRHWTARTQQRFFISSSQQRLWTSEVNQ